MKLYLVKNQSTKKLDLIDPATLTPVHEGFTSIEEAKETLQKQGHEVRPGSIVNSPYIGRYREVEYS